MGRKRGAICKSDGGAFKRRRGGGSDDEEYVFGVEEEEEEVEESLDDSLAGYATEEEFEYRESSCGSEEEPDFDCDEEEEEEEEDRKEAVDEEVVALEEVDAGSVMARIGRANRSRDLVEEELDYGLVRSRRRNAAVLDYAEDEEEDDDHDEDFLPDDGEDVDVDDEDIEPFEKRRKFKASRPELKKKLQGGGPDDYNDNDFDVECEPFFDYDVSDSDEDFIADNPIDKRRNKIKTAECRKRLLVVSGSDSDSLIFEGQLKNKGICMRQRGENVGVEFGKQRCGICLSEDQKRTVQGKLDCCAHFFCSACIMEWSKVETRCPVCKRRFSTITKTSKLDPMFGMNKVVRVQTRDQIYQPSEGEIRQMLDPYGNIVCTECQQAVDDHLMLLCDICDSCAHTYCVGLGREVPEGNWYCDCCRSATTVSSRVQNQDTFSGGAHKSESLTHGNEAVEDAVHIHSNSYSQPSESFPRLVASQRIDLNAPPTLDDDYDAAMYQVTGVGGSTLSGRRAIHQRICILLSNSRPRQMIRQNDVSNDKAEGNATPQEVQQSKGSLHASS